MAEFAAQAGQRGLRATLEFMPGTVFGKVLSQLILGDMTEQDLPLPVTDPRAPSLRPIKEMP